VRLPETQSVVERYRFVNEYFPAGRGKQPLPHAQKIRINAGTEFDGIIDEILKFILSQILPNNI